MPKEPLFPHRPKSRETQFPHVAKGREAKLLPQTEQKITPEEWRFAEGMREVTKEDAERGDVAGIYLWQIVTRHYPHDRDKQVRAMGFMNEVATKYRGRISREEAWKLAKRWDVEKMLTIELMEFLPQTKLRAKILWTRERSERRQEILKALGLELEPHWAQPWAKLPLHYREAIAAYYEAKEPPVTKGKPTRQDVEIGTWAERDRMGIWLTDKRSDKTIAEWWDEDAREMFEQGWFKPGDIRQQTITGRAFEESVLDYAESVGLIAGSGKYLAQTVPKEAYYWTAINKGTGEITESTVPYTSTGRALRGGRAFASRHWKGDEALIEVWSHPYHYSEKTVERPVATERLNPGQKSGRSQDIKHYWVEKNVPYESWAVVEAFPGGTVRSPFNTKEEAIKKEEQFAEYYGWRLKLVPSPQEKFPKQHEALRKLYPYEFVEYHDDGDLTIQELVPKPGAKPPVPFRDLVKGDLVVVTTDGKIFKQE